MRCRWMVIAILLAGAEVFGADDNDKSQSHEIEWLPPIERLARNGQHIDLALNNVERNEVCYYTTPSEQNGNKETSIDGVTMQNSSQFVSCRITIGPMERSLLGIWTLCGRYEENVRCQKANITWLNNNNQGAAWQVSTREQFNHSVSLMRYLNPSVNGSGNTRSCHVITPYGEDLLITTDSQYPGIQLETVSSSATCAVTIGPLERWMLGEWTLYGMFRRQQTAEIRLPMYLSLYDEGDPYTQPYNVTNLNPINRITNMGTSTILEVTGSGNIDSCRYRAPDGTMYEFYDLMHFHGVTIPDVGDSIICRISIGPIEETMLGDWQIIGQFSDNGIFTELRRSFTLIRGAGADFPEAEIQWLPLIERVTRTGQYLDIALNNIGEDEFCTFENPSGGQGNIQIEMYGVTVRESSQFVSCRITVGPMEASFLGNWTLCGRYGSNNEHKRCQKVNIAWLNTGNPSANWQVSQQARFNHSVNLGGYLRPTVNGSGNARSCHVVTPYEEDLVITPDSRYPGIRLENVTSSSSCAITIGPIERWMLGDWTLYGKFRRQVTTEARLPMSLSIFDEDNPYGQPYNITNRRLINHIILLGSNTTVQVNGSGNIDSCRYRAPDGYVYQFDSQLQFPGVSIPDVGNSIVCYISIGPIEGNMLGEWEIIGQFSDRGIFTEIRQPFSLTLEDPENPIIEDRNIQNLTSRHINTSIGSSERVIISRARFITPETCHIRTPAGRQYIMSESFNVSGVTRLNGSDIECGVSIDVLSEDMVGEWVLISRAMNGADAVERRLPFVIYVEEQVEAFPQHVTITENNDLLVRLRNPTEKYESCHLVGPGDDNSSPHQRDLSHAESCGFIVKSIQKSDQGIWQIVYGARIIYRAYINVTVIDRGTSFIEDLVLVKDAKVNKMVGPEDVVYCRLEDPAGFTVFEDFGRCQLAIERVTIEHEGYWTILIASPGRVLLEEFKFLVTVQEKESYAVVSTRVEKQRPFVLLTCSMSSEHSVRACKFRDPRGNILIATQGVGEDRYSFHGSVVSYLSNVYDHECGIRIHDPSNDDLGLWRCAIETEGGTHYGFLSVICPWLMQDIDVQDSVVTEPVLAADRVNISAIEGDGVTMACSIQSPIRYCYFRANNGTVLVVTPETSSPSLKYVGSGFDAGECGVRFNGLMSKDSGNWSCHVGLYNEEEEQRAHFNVNVQEPITVRHYKHEDHGLVVEAFVHSGRRLDYCRFIRIDGFGFTTDRIPDGYKFLGSLEDGHCLLQIEESSTLNVHPWTVVARVRGQRIELFKQTIDTLIDLETKEGSFAIYLWFILLGLTIVSIVVLLVPKKSRKWTYERASQLRTSIRNSFRKARTTEYP